MATFPHHYTSTIPRCVIRIEDSMYDVTAWRHSHPGGAELLDKFHNQDATEAFYSLHSKEAVQKLTKMKAQPAPQGDKRDIVSVNFQRFREQLTRDGFFDRHWELDWLYFNGPCFLLGILGVYLAWTFPFLAAISIGISMQQAGWLGHDYTHARGPYTKPLAYLFATLFNGFSRAWWSHKHNTHHVFPNRREYDVDIHNEPILHLWFPDSKDDYWFRKYQHIYYPFAYSFLFVSWRMQSIQFALGSRDWMERSTIALAYLALGLLPWKVALGSVLVGGFLVAIIVTSNHQTEPILAPNDDYNYVVDQFRTTRGVHCGNMFTEYIFGGMQYQLEHHLFPTMPKHNFHRVRPLLKQFAAENGMQYHISSVKEIFSMNYDVMRKYSQDHCAKSD